MNLLAGEGISDQREDRGNGEGEKMNLLTIRITCVRIT